MEGIRSSLRKHPFLLRSSPLKGDTLSLSRSVGRVGENPGNEVGPY